MRKIVLVVTALLLVAAAGVAGIYEIWRDTGDIAHYAKAPPAEGAPPRQSGPAAAGDGASVVKLSCTFANSPTECGFRLQARASDRASIVNIGRDGTTSLRLRTEPGDDNVAGSGAMERTDVYLSQEDTGCYEGREQWWEHSILFPDDYVAPPASADYSFSWNVIFDFHNSAPGPWQANFHTEVATLSPDPNDPQRNPDPPVLRFRGYGGVKSGDGAFTAPIGSVVRNTWYDFVYHVKWSPGPDGFFNAWVNGARKLAHRGPTLYAGQGCYLKLANYHVPFRQPSSVIHDRVIRRDVGGSPQGH